MKPIIRYTLLFSSLLFFAALCSCGIRKYKGITYLPSDLPKADEMKLDVYSPKDVASRKDVLIFFHGGGWSHGKRKQYKFFGKRMARKGLVAVIVDYPLSPAAGWNDMAIASAKAVKWTKENIGSYGGDSSRIFISGHSAGGHLAALLGVKDMYFSDLGIRNPVKGVILIDAAGLDMYNYLKSEAARGETHYQQAFTSNPDNWREASPIYFLHKGVPPMLLLVGGKTYPNIAESNIRFTTELTKYTPIVGYKVVKRKHHIPMIFQFYNAHNPLYKEILKFMHDVK